MIATLHIERADSGWLGILFILGAIAVQLMRAMQRGPVPPPPAVPRPAYHAPAPVPVPELEPRSESSYAPSDWSAPEEASVPPSTLPPRLRELFEELSVPPAPPVLPPLPVFQSAPKVEPVPVLAATSEAGLLALAAAARRMEAAETGAEGSPSSHAWTRLRLHTREEWQRGLVVSEILQPPVALR